MKMKKLFHISLTFILAIVLIAMASGVTFRHCSCSGKTTMLIGHLEDNHAPFDKGGKGDAKGDRPLTKGCMTFSSVSLSPTTPMHPADFDFHAFQPLVAIVNDWHLLISIPQPVESTKKLLSIDEYSPPPRQYLHLLRVLTI